MASPETAQPESMPIARACQQVRELGWINRNAPEVANWIGGAHHASPNHFSGVSIARTLGREVTPITPADADIPFDLRYLR